MKYTFFIKNDEYSHQIADQIRSRLINTSFIETEDHPELCIVVGGDGTFLMAVHQYLYQLKEVAFIGVHTGTLGFMCDYTSKELDEFTNDLLQGAPTINSYRLLKIEYDGKTQYALNEMRVENVYKTQIFDIMINGSLFETYRGTGICLSTQMGSTGYNRSIGGAVVQYGMPVLQMSEIAGIHHKQYQSLRNPLILAPDTKIEFRSESFKGAILCFDQNYVALDDVNLIQCRNSAKEVRVMKYRPYNYFKRLKNLF